MSSADRSSATMSVQLDEDSLMNKLPTLYYNDEVQYQTTWYRWVILTLYTLAASIGAAFSMSFSPVAVIVSDAYGVNVMLVNMCSICFMATYIPTSFLVIWMF